MQRLLCLLLAFMLAATPAQASIIPSIPYNLTNGSLADATQVMGNFNTIVNNVNSNGAHSGANSDITSLTGLTTPLASAYGGTVIYTGGTTGGSANAQTLASVSPSNFTLTVGSLVTGIAGFSNSGAATLNVNSTGATAMRKASASGLVAVTTGDIIVGQYYMWLFDGTYFELVNPTLPSNVVTGPGSAVSGNIPTFNGTSGNVLQDSGLTTTSFIRKVKIQTFTSSGTYTPTTGMVYANVELWGGGGGGGGVNTAAFGVGSGGGAGGYARKIVSAAAVGSSQSITVGAGGTAGANTGGNGGTGGTTSFGAIFQATGGSGGHGDTTGGATGYSGGTGGTGSGGDDNATGAAGGHNSYNASTEFSGDGGASSRGGNAVGQPYVADAAGNNAVNNSGSGGAGAAGNGTAHVGGVGGSGIVVITEYLNQ